MSKRRAETILSMAIASIASIAFVPVAACRESSSTTIAPDPAPKKPTPAPAPAPPPLPDVRVRVTMNDARSYAIEVTNAGSGPVDVAHALDLERLSDGGWTSALAKDTVLELDCAKSACATIAAGATLHPGAWWVSTAGCVQDRCVCEDGGACIVDCISVPAPPGTYRVVARSCDGKERWESAPFVVPPS